MHRQITRRTTTITSEHSTTIITKITQETTTKIITTIIIIIIITIPITEEITKMVVTTTGPTANITITTTKGKIKHTSDGLITSVPKIEMKEDGVTEDRGAEPPRMREEAGNKGETRPC